MTRRQLHQEPWSWTLDETDEGLVLTVLCGSVGLHEVAVVLEPPEITAWEEHGAAGLEPLAVAIRYDGTGERFAARSRPDLVAGSDGP